MPYATPGRVPWWERVRERMDWLAAGVYIAAGLLVMWATSVPGGYFLGLMVSIPAWVVLTVGWVLYVGGGWVWRRVTKRPGRGGSVKVATVWVPGAMTVVAVLALTTWFPLHARFALSWWAMERWAAAPTGTSGYIGLFPAESFMYPAAGPGFAVRGAGFIDREGFVYVASGTPPTFARGLWYRHFHGRWYVVTEKF